MRAIILVFFCCCLLLQLAAAKPVDDQTKKYQKEIKRLQVKLKTVKSKKQRFDIQKLIDNYQSQLKKSAKRPGGPLFSVTYEAVSEEIVASSEIEEEIAGRARVGDSAKLKFQLGGTTGIFAGATALLAEARFPLRAVIGPATSSVRLATGLAQSWEMDRRFVPVNLDLLLNFPPEAITGLDNYLGFGLNYLVLTTGQKAGTLGGQIFYGVESEGFGGRIFGEIGYAIMRTGFSSAQRGTTVMVGFRKFGLF